MRLFVFSFCAAIAAVSFIWGGMPAHAQGAPTPGLHSLEMTDDTADALYKLKSGADASDPADTDKSTSDTPDAMQSPPNAPVKKTEDTPVPSGDKKSQATQAVDPNLQSHTLTLIPDAPTDAKSEDVKDNKNKDLKETSDKSNQKDISGKSDNGDDDTTLDPHLFTATAKLKPWDKRDTLYGVGQNTDKIRAALIVFESEPEYANPQALMDVAALYAQVGDYKSAARYYYAANLRRAFDTVRFPSSNIPVLDAGPWGESVGAWVTNSSARMQTTLNDVRAWDERISYRYHPGYTVTERSINTPVPSESEWADILTKTRSDFFKSVGEMSQALGRMGK